MEQNWLTVKTLLVEAARRIFFDMSININSEGKRRSGVCIGTNQYKSKNIQEEVKDWVQEIDKISRNC